jgi:hypothetical protein
VHVGAYVGDSDSSGLHRVMSRTSTWLVLAFLLAAVDARAFEQCEQLTTSPSWLTEVGEDVLARTPVKYYDLALRIRLLPTDASQVLSPQAIEVGGSMAVVVAPVFATVLCKVALSMYLAIDGKDPAALETAALAAGRCFDNGGTQRACLVAFADSLAARYRQTFAALRQMEQNTAHGIASNTMTQVVLHEYAHHYFGHRRRIAAGTLAREDAEFEADFFAIMSGVQAGDAPSAMYYFFGAVAEIEANAKRLDTHHESADCRARNVNNVTGAISIVPMVLLEVASGGRQHRLRDGRAAYTVASEELSKPYVAKESCGKLAPATLRQTFQELRSLHARMAPDVEMLLNIGAAEPGRVRALLRDLSVMSQGSVALKGLISKVVSLVVRMRGLTEGDLAPIVAAVDNVVAEDFLAGDFGRLLQMQGLAIVQDRVDLRYEVRMGQGRQLLERAVYFNPELSEAWMNLAFLRFKVGDCDGAADAAARSAATSSTDEQAKSSNQLAQVFSQWKGNPRACAAEGAGFHPYPGL